MSKLQKVFEGHWDEIKGQLKKQWGKLTDNDIKQIDGSLDELIGKLEKHYGYEVAQIEDEIYAFLNSNEIEVVKSKVKSIKDDVIENAEDIKNLVREYVHEYFTKMKTTTMNAEEQIVKYCKSNPLKTAGILMLAGAAVGALIANRK